MLNRLNQLPYHWPVGRVMFQKLCYFGTQLGLKTGLTYQRGSYGPFAPELKRKLAQLQNNKLVMEKPTGKMFRYELGEMFYKAQGVFKKEFEANKKIIEKLIDLFCRFDTKGAELAATIHFALQTMENNDTKPSEMDLLDEVMEWKKRRRPPIDKTECAETIRNLAIHNWIDVKPSKAISSQIESEVEA